MAAGIHTSSAVNNAEVVPVVGDSVETYLRQNVELAARLGCGHVIVHGGYHFGDRQPRREAARQRLARVATSAARLGVALWFENHNAEPELAEIHYQPRDADETAWFLDRLPAATVRWAFNVAHAHLVPEGIDGFLDRFGIGRIAQVRLNDNPGTHEVHLVPGEGTIDFAPVFQPPRPAGLPRAVLPRLRYRRRQATSARRFRRLAGVGLIEPSPVTGGGDVLASRRLPA